MAWEIGAWEYVVATATASETITVTEGRTAEAIGGAAATASTSEAVTVTDTATQAVGIRVSAAEWSGEDTLTSSNW